VKQQTRALLNVLSLKREKMQSSQDKITKELWGINSMYHFINDPRIAKLELRSNDHLSKQIKIFTVQWYLSSHYAKRFGLVIFKN
jgi:hypothetical protein